jgi:hypothetical protein
MARMRSWAALAILALSLAGAAAGAQPEAPPW